MSIISDGEEPEEKIDFAQKKVPARLDNGRKTIEKKEGWSCGKWAGARNRQEILHLRTREREGF